MNPEIHLKLLKALEANPEINQRELAASMDMSLGKVNYCIKALLEKGYIKTQNFRNNKNKLAYLYLLTPSGVEEKAKLTVSFLQRKIREYEELEKEIAALKKEVG